MKILSVLLAALLWLVITNVDDPVIPKPFNNVLVTILNEDVINTSDQIYEILEGETVSFRVAARRSIADNLTSSDFNVTADFAKMLEGNTVLIDITCKKSDVTITEGNRQTLTIKREKLLSEDFKVNVMPKGKVTEGYYVGEKSASPNIVRVTGPMGRIEKIKEVVAEVNVTGVSRSLNKTAELKALDEEGNVIDDSKLTFSEKYPEISLKLYKTKTVDLIARTEGEPAIGYVMTGIEYEPKTVVIASEDNSILENTNALYITENIEGESGDIERDVDLQEALELPKGVILVGDNLTVGINIKIEKLETKEFNIWPNDIKFRNKKDFQDVAFNTTGPIRVKVRGPKNEIEALERNTLKPYLDLADCNIGTYALNIQAELPKHTTIYDTPMVSIWIAS